MTLNHPLSKTTSLNSIQPLKKHYTFTNSSKISTFLEQNPSLINILLEAPNYIYQYFPETHLILEIDYDPEIVNEVKLFLLILIQSKSENLSEYNIDYILQLEEKLSYNWYLKITPEIRKLFCFGTELA